MMKKNNQKKSKAQAKIRRYVKKPQSEVSDAMRKNVLKRWGENRPPSARLSVSAAAKSALAKYCENHGIRDIVAEASRQILQMSK